MSDSVSENLLATRLVKDYNLPETQGTFWSQSFLINPNRPRFTRALIPLMKRDPRLRLGIALLKGPIIQNVKFRVEASSPNIAAWAEEQLDLFRLNGMASALDSFWWGWSAHEIIYRKDFQGNWGYSHLERIDVADAKVVHVNGVLKGMNVYRVTNPTNKERNCTYVPIPKCLWNVHQRVENKWFGLPAVYGSFEPWWETWCQKGYRDTRALWFFKNAFSGPMVYYPTGSTPVATTQEGQPVLVSNKQLADEIYDKLQTGSGASIPCAPDSNANSWRIERGDSSPIPDGLIQYGMNLAAEKLEGLGVLPEIVAADGAGSYSGRSIPMQGFMAIIQDYANEVTQSFTECCLMPNAKRMGGVNGGVRVLVEGLYEATPYANDIDDPMSMGEDGNMDDPNASATANGSPTDQPTLGPQKNQKAKQKPGGNNGSTQYRQ